MPEAILGNVAGAVVGGLMSDSGGGATQTASKTPWAAAVPWLTANLQTGQNLQNAYQANPFNAIQQASYGNLLGGNDYISQMVPGLLSQMSQSRGFDRNNPRALPQAYQFPAMQPASFQPTAGLLGVSMGSAAAPAAPASQPAPQAQPMGVPASQLGITNWLDLARQPTTGAAAPVYYDMPGG